MSAKHYVTVSSGILAIPCLEQLLGASVSHPQEIPDGCTPDGVLVWGRRKTARKGEALAAKLSLPIIRLEDGFLRSYGPGRMFAPLSLTVDDQGIYYDATTPSALEHLLENGDDLIGGLNDGQEARIKNAMSLVRMHGLGKYNHVPADATPTFSNTGRKRILIVDQTVGDPSVSYGLASAKTFSDMLACAKRENADADFYIKAHPEVVSGKKKGFLQQHSNDERVSILTENYNVWQLLTAVDHVYVVTSQLGFEALLAGKRVSCFGVPWYAGWGITDDRQHCVRRTRQRKLEELFAAAYFHYCRYLNPLTHQRGTILDVIDWLAHQRDVTSRCAGRTVAVGFRRWKAANIGPLLALEPKRVHFVHNAAHAQRLDLNQHDRLLVWGVEAPEDVLQLAQRTGATLMHMEDGFTRSVGLGSDYVPPLSLVLDSSGMYFDPRTESALEKMLNTQHFSSHDLQRAEAARRFIIKNDITKYNTEVCEAPCWATNGKKVVLVPGQVEDDASIRFGCEGIRTNMALLQAARQACPDAYIVYKPHPDVSARKRKGGINEKLVQQYADHVEQRCSMVSCIAAASVVHTMTSLSGFEALLREKSVTVYGRPFYAGWGLTDDRLAIPRRRRKLSLDELTAGALLHYPLYWDWELNGYTQCEAVLHQLVLLRQKLLSGNAPQRKWPRYIQRKWLELQMLLKFQFRIHG